tara:strand:- start:129 stop:443 length:315 start_codon:yes stop_codon:yes gene_type:complete
MAKENLTERFQKLAGIKPLASLKEDDIKEQMMYSMEEDPIMKEEIFTALAGLAGVLGMAGITTALEVAMDDPSFQEKHPKAAEALQKIIGFMRKIGGDVSKGIK